MSSLRRGHANLLCIVPILVYILPKRAPTPVFLPGKFHGQRSLVGYSPRGPKRVRHTLATKQQFRVYYVLGIDLTLAFTVYLPALFSLNAQGKSLFFINRWGKQGSETWLPKGTQLRIDRTWFWTQICPAQGPYPLGTLPHWTSEARGVRKPHGEKHFLNSKVPFLYKVGEAAWRQLAQYSQVGKVKF